MLIKSNQIYLEHAVLDGYLEIINSQFAAIYPSDTAVESYIDYSGYRIIPGIIDTHNHGTHGYGLIGGNCETPAETINSYLKACAAEGITGVFPTVGPEMCKYVAGAAREQTMGAKILGIHSEGPYLNRVGEGGVYTEPPAVDMAVIKQIYEDCHGMLKLMAISPELKGSQEAIDYLRKKGVTLSYAHSNEDYEGAMRAFENGLSVSTHTGNVMSGIHHRKMGGLGACLLNEDVQCEIICDGMHISPVMIELMFRVKNADRWMMISDSSEAAGAPAGKYQFAGFTVKVDENGFCKTDSGRLLGSTKSVLYGLSVLVDQVGLPLTKAIRLSALNAARFYGFGSHKGSIKLGKDADFVVIDPNYRAVATYVEGRKVFDAFADHDIFNPAYIREYQKLN